MSVVSTKRKGSWREVADNARTTIGLDSGIKEPTDSWKKQILLAEHSPIRSMQFSWKWLSIPYFVSVHFVRHWLGILHYVKTSRSDRTGIDRETLSQNHPVNHACEANVQALINISRKRLCAKASKETQIAWQEVVDEVKILDPIVGEVLVPECIYRGFCPEFQSCGYTMTSAYCRALEKYRNVQKKVVDKPIPFGGD